MKIKCTVIIVFLFPLLAQPQDFQIDKPPLPIDSLKKVLPFLRDSARVDCLNELARSYLEIETPAEFDTAWLFANQAYQEAFAINYKKGLGDACLKRGLLAQWHHWNVKEMEKYFSEAITWYEKIKYDDGLGHAFYGLGRAARGLGSVIINPVAADEEEWKAFEQSAFHFRKSGNRIMLAELTDQFGLVYNEKGEFEKYFESIKQGLREKKSINDNRGLIHSFYRLAYVYLAVGDFESALDYFRQSYHQARSQSIPWNIGRSMGDLFRNLKMYDSSIYYYHDLLEKHLPGDAATIASIGRLYLIRKEYDTALVYLQTAITTCKKTSNVGKLMPALVDMGKSYIGLKQYTKALMYADECLPIAKHYNSKDVMWQLYELYWNIYEGLRQKDSAYFYYLKFVPLRDSLDNARLKLQHIKKLALYKVEAREEEQLARIELLNKDNQIKEQQLQDEAMMKKILAGSFVTLVLLSVIFFRNIALKRKNERHRRELAENNLQIQKLESERTNAALQQQATALEMQALRAQMNPHFIFNCLSSINRFILKNESEPASDYLTKFSRLIRMVLNNSKKAFISLEDELEMLRLYLEMERLRFRDSFEYNIIFRNEINPENVFIPPLLLQPFAENAIWHGLMHKQDDGHLNIELSIDNKILTCVITDDGVGRTKAALIKSKSAEKQKSMGMQITTERLALLNRDIQLKTFLKIEDITDDTGAAAGTRVILKIQHRTMAEAFT